MSQPASSSTTLTRSGSAESAGPLAGQIQRLYLALEGDRPQEPPLELDLEGAHEVVIGRGAERRLEREGGKLRLAIPDERMSQAHARLTRDFGRWVLEDNGSKNGVFLHGVLQKRALLGHGDVIECGHTLFYFTERAAPPGGLPAQRARVGQPGLATFVPDLAVSFNDLQQVAPSRVPVVIRGETGTGKELLARALHELSGRSGPFVAVNCGALPANLIESELFGFRKGAFTGASEDRKGLVRSAHEGTLLLDEIGDLPLSLQVAFLRFLQEGEVLPLGSSQTIKVDVRVVAATHRDLELLVGQDRFRNDLLARLSGFTVRLPPLKDRKEDLGLIVSSLLARLVPRGQDLKLGREVARALFNYTWPQNVRELEKALEVAVTLAQAQGGRLELHHLPEPVRVATTIQPLRPVTRPVSVEDEKRRAELVDLLRQHDGNVSAVARAMGVARMQIQRWLKRFRIDAASFRR